MPCQIELQRQIVEKLVDQNEKEKQRGRRKKRRKKKEKRKKKMRKETERQKRERGKLGCRTVVDEKFGEIVVFDMKFKSDSGGGQDNRCGEGAPNFNNAAREKFFSDRVFCNWDLETERVTSGGKIRGKREQSRKGNSRETIDNIETSDKVGNETSMFQRLQFDVREARVVGEVRETRESFGEGSLARFEFNNEID